MNCELIITGDGSHTLFLPGLKEQYHSLNGAIQESKHVFIDAGLKYCKNTDIKIFEFGFGTGLNALLTLIYAENNKINITYHSIEKYPLNRKIFNQLNYPLLLNVNRNVFFKLHDSAYEELCKISKFFNFYKIKNDILNYKLDDKYDLVYFDAFGPDVQPEVWGNVVLERICNALLNKGILVTYCAKGVIKRRLKEIGFEIEALPGPPGKREMIRAIKL